MDLKAFWLGWRRDIVRFVALCLVALAVGLLINGAKAGVHDGLTHLLPTGSLDGLKADLDFDPEPGPPPQLLHTAEPWTYRAHVAPGQTVWVRDMRGSITVEPGRGESLIVTAVKHFSDSDPDEVHLLTVATNDGIAICAVWDENGEGRCGPGDEYKAGNAHDNDVAVEFTVRLPRGVQIRATTVTGAVSVAGATAPILAGTVDGAVDAETMNGPLHAYSVNGSVRAAVRGFGDTGAVKVTTVNGSVTLELPAELDATVNAKTINGAITSDFPLTTTGKLVAHRATGDIGQGGRRVEVTAVNGSIQLKRAAPSVRR